MQYSFLFFFAAFSLGGMSFATLLAWRGWEWYEMLYKEGRGLRALAVEVVAWIPYTIFIWLMREVVHAVPGEAFAAFFLFTGAALLFTGIAAGLVLLFLFFDFLHSLRDLEKR
jgi:hypothetical protein